METKEELLTTFPAVYRYVNKRYCFIGIVYPALVHLNEDGKEIFILNHILLHLIKSMSKRERIFSNTKEEHESKLQYLSMPDDALSSPRGIESKRAYLKTVITILALCHNCGIDEEMITGLDIPDTQPKTFNEHVDEYIPELATLLEEADHRGRIAMEEVKEITLPLYLNMLYWFDTFWLPGFLEQIPTVMK